jgi:signal transduction histidine kinase
MVACGENQFPHISNKPMSQHTGDGQSEGGLDLPKPPLVVLGQSLRAADHELLTLLAGQATVALERGRRAEQLDALHRISTALAASLDLDVISATALSWLGASLPLAEARLLMPSTGEAGHLERVWRPEALAALVATDKPGGLLAPHMLEDPGDYIGPAHDSQGRVVVAVALRCEQRMCGALELAAQPGAGFSEDEIAFLVALAVPLALALENARQHHERQRMAQQLVQSEKLASVGRLAASIAHEVNNPLHAIYNSLDIMLTHQLSDEKRQRYLAMAHAEAQRLIGVVQRIIDVHRPSREGMRPAAIPGLLDAALDALAPQILHSHVQVVRDWNEPLPQVFAIRSHLRQVFSSLIVNALESMPDGGTLTIRARAEGAEGGAQHVVIAFSDNGLGIADHELHKVFEPFYTTKVTGTGLGLAISYTIVQQHGGELSAQSKPGADTTFEVRLPAAT